MAPHQMKTCGQFGMLDEFSKQIIRYEPNSASPGPTRTALWHWRSIAAGFAELLGQRGSLRKPLGCSAAKAHSRHPPGINAFHQCSTCFTLSTALRSLGIEKYIVHPHLCKVTSSCAAYFPNLLEYWLMQEQP